MAGTPFDSARIGAETNAAFVRFFHNRGLTPDIAGILVIPSCLAVSASFAPEINKAIIMRSLVRYWFAAAVGLVNHGLEGPRTATIVLAMYGVFSILDSLVAHSRSRGNNSI